MSALGQEVTLGEVARNVQAVRLDLAKMTELIGERPDWQDVKRVELGLESKISAASEKSKGEIAALKERLGRLEGWGNWATKLALGAVGAAVLGSAISNTG